ncbi:MAG: hypothetical protein AVDCRST_MAG11-3471 [uncultured Gemmatimonadaceae bacterium]|uniref:DUF1802 family protein n=1 Tax=uncultured Gemmatimonadaceae bacterium TaxID=246130 RepID=A0A6J4M4V0_9BACT|nr:MAG: hypothetical protein AVDCRST_MAG11-3471 [uncultured Gemmatimonadaceae bacterium]
MPPDPERTALKEWAVLVDAMARGDIVAMVRKGGIREQRAGFSVRHGRFLFYPTYFHEKAAELAPRFLPTLDAAHARRPPEGEIRLEYLADVAAVWRVDDVRRLRAVEGEHGLTPAAAEARFHYKNRPGVQVVAARVLRLPEPAHVPEARRYGGCVSWVELDAAVDVAGARPVLDAAAFDACVARLRAALGDPAAEVA